MIGKNPLTVATITLLITSLLIACSPTHPEEDGWVLGAELHWPRVCGVAEEVSGRIYVIGGCFRVSSIDGITSPTEIYEPATDSWSEGASLPTPRDEMASGIYNGRIYVFGGMNHENRISSALEIYDPAADNWTIGSSIPDTLTNVVGAFYQDRYYLFGYHYYHPNTHVWTYNPATDIWDSSPLILSEALRCPTAVEIYCDKLCLSLGFTIVSFDTGDGSLQTITDIELIRLELAQGVVGKKWICTGGCFLNMDDWTTEARGETAIFDGETWTDADPLPIPVWGAATCTLGNKFYLISGSVTQTVQILTVR
jgi:hypothetical protein